MVTTLASLRRNSARVIRRMNKDSKQIVTIRMKNISNINVVPSEHSFWKYLLVPI